MTSNSQNPENQPRRPVPGTQEYEDMMARLMAMLRDDYIATQHYKVGQNGEVIGGNEIHDYTMPTGEHYRETPQFVELDDTGTSFFPLNGVTITHCHICGKRSTDKTLVKCSTCGKYLCVDHAAKGEDEKFSCRSHALPDQIGSVVAFVGIVIFLLYLLSLFQ